MRRTSLALILAFAATAFFPARLTTAQTAPPKRPMTFEDMMHMKRLGSTAVSPDGKWLAYSVTNVDLDANTKSPELWLQPIAGGDPQKVTVAQPGDDGIQFSPDGHFVLFLSGRSGSEQIWLASFDSANADTADAGAALRAPQDGEDHRQPRPLLAVQPCCLRRHRTLHLRPLDRAPPGTRTGGTR